MNLVKNVISVSDKIAIRFATKHDAGVISELSSQLGYPSTSEEILDRLTLITPDATHEVFVAENSEEIVVGWLHVLTGIHLESGRFAEIAGLVVDEQCRGEGIGKLLVDTAEKWALKIGCTTMTVRSNIIRKETHKFYAQLGYPVTKQQMVFKKNLALPSKE